MSTNRANSATQGIRVVNALHRNTDLDVVSKFGIWTDKSNVLIIPFADLESELRSGSHNNGFRALEELVLNYKDNKQTHENNLYSPTQVTTERSLAWAVQPTGEKVNREVARARLNGKAGLGRFFRDSAPSDPL